MHQIQSVIPAAAIHLSYGFAGGVPVFKRPDETEHAFRERLIDERRAK